MTGRQQENKRERDTRSCWMTHDQWIGCYAVAERQSLCDPIHGPLRGESPAGVRELWRDESWPTASSLFFLSSVTCWPGLCLFILCSLTHNFRTHIRLTWPAFMFFCSFYYLCIKCWPIVNLWVLEVGTFGHILVTAFPSSTVFVSLLLYYVCAGWKECCCYENMRAEDST